MTDKQDWPGWFLAPNSFKRLQEIPRNIIQAYLASLVADIFESEVSVIAIRRDSSFGQSSGKKIAWPKDSLTT
jgi:hypothetical protein